MLMTGIKEKIRLKKLALAKQQLEYDNGPKKVPVCPPYAEQPTIVKPLANIACASIIGGIKNQLSKEKKTSQAGPDKPSLKTKDSPRKNNKVKFRYADDYSPEDG